MRVSWVEKRHRVALGIATPLCLARRRMVDVARPRRGEKRNGCVFWDATSRPITAAPGANTLKPSVASPARNGVPKRVINMACEAFGLSRSSPPVPKPTYTEAHERYGDCVVSTHAGGALAATTVHAA